MSGEILSKQQGETVGSGWDELSAMPAFEERRPLSYAEKKVESVSASFENIVANNHQRVKKMTERAERLQQKIADETDEWRRERYMQQLRDAEATLRDNEALVEFARIPTAEDIEERERITRNFAQEYVNSVKETVPDDLPLVFHGTNNIGRVREIVRSHGLLTPEQRGESMKSFATQIDVTAKTNIRVSCEFAESNNAWMPYGAIFAFMPKPEEIEEVLNTGDNSEVFGGVDGVNFKDEPERLYGIITTTENVPRVQAWCRAEGLDESKVLTHDGFLQAMQELDDK